MYVCMNEYYTFSPHNGVAIANVLISFFSPVNDNFDLSRNYYNNNNNYYYINRLSLYFVCKFFIVSFYVLVLTL
jgi:hypothetical protein